MYRWVLGSICAGLSAFAWGCSAGATGSSTGGSGGAGGAPETGSDAGPGGGGGESPDAPCTIAAQGLPVSKGRGTTPSIVWTGAGYAVAWQDLSADEGDVHLATFDAEGNKTREEIIEGGSSISSHPSVHRAGEGLLVLWQDRYGAGSIVRGRRATLSGQPQGVAFSVAPSAATESWPIGAPGEGASLVTWMDADRSLLGFLADGALTSTIPLDEATFPSVAAEGGQAALAWVTDSAIAFARPRSGSASLDPIFHAVAVAKLPRVALGGDDAFIAWEDTRSGLEQIRMIGVSEQGGLSEEALVSRSQGSANWPSLAWTGRGLAVAYYQFRDGPPAIFVSLMGRDLEPLGADLKVSGNAPARFPAVAWTGRELGIAYAENDRGVRLSRAICR
jgi:hypothetical protein